MERRTKVALAFTVLYLVGLFFVVYFKDAKFLGLELNELGDFVAGAFGPLALAWLIFGYFQQGEELQQGTKALRIQGEELKNSVEQQRQLAEISLQALELERQERLSEEAKHRHSLKPIFHIDTLQLTVDGGNYVAKCRLYNDGAQVYSLRVTFLKEDLKVHCGAVRTLNRGDNTEFKFAWPIRSPGDFISVHIHYTDRDSLQAMSKFVSETSEKLGKVNFVNNDDDLV